MAKLKEYNELIFKISPCWQLLFVSAGLVGVAGSILPANLAAPVLAPTCSPDLDVPPFNPGSERQVWRRQRAVGGFLSIWRPRQFGIIGPNGAAKTTLINAISVLVRATRGRILFDGHEVQSEPAHMIARPRSRAGIPACGVDARGDRDGKHPRRPNACSHLCLLSIASFAPRGLRKSRAAGRAGALALLEKLDLAALHDVRVGSFPTAR